MVRDMSKKNATDLKSQQKHYKQVTMKIRKDSGILEALDKTGIPPAAYAQNALCEKLRAEGYLDQDKGYFLDKPEE